MVPHRDLMVAVDFKFCFDYGMQSTMKHTGYNAVDKIITDLPRMKTEQRQQPHQELHRVLELF